LILICRVVTVLSFKAMMLVHKFIYECVRTGELQVLITVLSDIWHYDDCY